MKKESSTLSEGEMLMKILSLIETHLKSPPKSSSIRVYDNKAIMAILKIKDKYLKKLRDYGYLGYSREGDKYWYTQEDLDKFLQRFHYAPFNDADVLPQI